MTIACRREEFLREIACSCLDYVLSLDLTRPGQIDFFDSNTIHKSNDSIDDLDIK